MLSIYPYADGDRQRAWAEAKRRYQVSRVDRRCHDRSVVRTLDQHLRQEYAGALGELLVAEHHFGIPWDPQLDVFHDVPDVGTCDVRTVEGTRRCLIIRDDDPPDRPFILTSLLIEGERGWVRGWMYARDAQRPEWLKDPHEKRPAWFVPASHLEPMRALPLSPGRPSSEVPPTAAPS